VILVTASSASRTDSVKAAQDTLDVVPSVLATLQRQLTVPVSSVITSMQLTTVSAPTINDKSRKRAVLALAGVGTVGSILLVGFLDGLLLSRRTRKEDAGPVRPSRAAGPPEEAPPESESTPPVEGTPVRLSSSREVRAGR
jgi:hypothetical protein